MACTTTCTNCGTCYEETSEEEANSPNRTCTPCFRAKQAYQDAITGADPKATEKLNRALRAGLA